jgi:hypothetical protein
MKRPEGTDSAAATSRVAAMSMDGTPVSDADLARMHAEEELHAHWRRSAVRVVAASAHDAADARLLLSILGLADDVAAARAECPPRRRRSRARAA